MSWMFSGCSSLKEINLSNINTNNVTDMSWMFYKCSLLKEINLSNFNINNVTDMSEMFYGCLSLKEIDLSNFNTNNITNMGRMFSGCSDEIKGKIKQQIKNIKQRLNLNINDYKEYCETYSSIEIELVPVKDKFGKFININDKNKLYIHIYFNLS